MITLYFTDCQWGITPIDSGIQINLLEPDAKILAQVPFSGDALEELVWLACKELNVETVEKIATKRRVSKDEEN